MKRFALGCALVAQLMYPVHAIARTEDMALQGYALPQDKPVTIVLMRPQVDVGELQAGGIAQPNAEWTAQARTNLRAALEREFGTREIALLDMETEVKLHAARQAEAAQAKCKAEREAARIRQMAAESASSAEASAQPAAVAASEVSDTGSAGAKAPVDDNTAPAMLANVEAEARAALDDTIRVCAARLNQDTIDPEQIVAEYYALHSAVVDAITIHKYDMGPQDITVGSVLLGGLASGGSGKLPTQEGKFDYTLGSGTERLGEVSGANYGLFLMTKDQFGSDGRKAMQVAGALGCLIGACMIVSGGTHVAYASLVELETGRIVWFNMQRGSEGDVREPEGATEMIRTILETMPAKPGERIASSAAQA